MPKTAREEESEKRSARAGGRPPRTAPRLPPRLAAAAAVAAIFSLPLVGLLLAGRSTAGLFRFPPPLRISSGYLPFSWLAAATVVAILAATFLPWCRRRPSAPAHAPGAPEIHPPRESHPPRAHRRARLPLWGVLALGWTAAWWAVAWTRLGIFEGLQRYTFLPLWLGFVIAVNALTHARTGTCLMLRAPGRWLALFAASAACWWAFEWLNRFVRNWHYLNVGDLGPGAYALHATLSFATVLPALAALAEWLQSHAGWRRRVAAGPRWRWLGAPRTPWLLAGGGALALVGAGAWPDWFYPALWLGPLALLLALPGAVGKTGSKEDAGSAGATGSVEKARSAEATGGRQLTRELAAGDWSRAATWMAAALICGFFWELWNWHSFAKWIYTVPGVERWHLFEMPALGYAGYLPFGLECLLVAEWAIGPAWQNPPPPAAR